ncbi:MAG: PilZ domain-containing protein [Clostridiaceae bacterium]|nr:PilZ domain-containing protein [Clostridiaceae bacterium]
MKILSQLKIGEKLEIEPIAHKEFNRNTSITSQLVDIKDNMFFIANPIKLGKVYPLSVGQQIKIIFHHQDKGVYSFPAEVLQEIADKILIYRVEPIGRVRKIQRRDYYRLQILIKALIKRVEDNEYIEGFTRDISGGGLRVVAKTNFQINDRIECKIHLDKNSVAVVMGKVIRVEKNTSTNEGNLSIEYDNIDETTKKEIIAFIFNKQRELRQKGLI